MLNIYVIKFMIFSITNRLLLACKVKSDITCSKKYIVLIENLCRDKEERYGRVPRLSPVTQLKGPRGDGDMQ